MSEESLEKIRKAIEKREKRLNKWLQSKECADSVEYYKNHVLRYYKEGIWKEIIKGADMIDAISEEDIKLAEEEYKKALKEWNE